MRAQPSSRLPTLDAMRGTASLAVVLYHLGFAGTFAAHGYLAVDFFFLLSGVVITRAYQGKLERGMTPLDFMIERVIRFYPLYILALAIGFGRKAMQISIEHPGAMRWQDLLISASFNGLLLPSPLTHELTPLNVVTWSLLLELLVNVVWAQVLVRMSLRSLRICAGVLALMLGTMIVTKGSSGGGSEWRDIPMGALRGCFGFVMGMVLARSIAPRAARVSALAMLAVVALAASFVVDVPERWRAVHDLLAIFMCFPLVMYLALTFSPPRSFQGLARVLGEVSFPVYTMHFGVLYGFLFVARWLGFDVGVGPGVWIVAYLVLVLALALVLARTYEPAARRLLRALVSKRRAALLRTP